MRLLLPFVSGVLLPPVCGLGILFLAHRVPAPKPLVLGVSIEHPTPTATPSPSLIPSPTLTPTPYPTIVPSPTVTPIPTPIPVTAAQLDIWFTQYANHYSIERLKLWQMAVCESGLRSNARNGDYGGMYQFSTSTWRSTRRQMNEDPNPTLRFNPEQAIKTAAFKISTVGLSAWPVCGKSK